MYATKDATAKSAAKALTEHYKTYSNEETSIAECANKEVTFTCSLQYLKEIQIQSGLKTYQ